MTGNRVYIAGPMTGLPDYNFPAFHAAALLWRSRGWEVFNPAEVAEEDGFDCRIHTPTIAQEIRWKRREMEAIPTCQAIYLLRGWCNSSGAKSELHAALHIPLFIWTEE